MTFSFLSVLLGVSLLIGLLAVCCCALAGKVDEASDAILVTHDAHLALVADDGGPPADYARPLSCAPVTEVYRG